MRRLVAFRPRAGSILGLIALAIASVGAVSTLTAGDDLPRDAVGLDAAERVPPIKYVRVEGQLNRGGERSVNAICPDGYAPVAGGFETNSPNALVPVSQPYKRGGKWVAWGITVTNPHPFPRSDSTLEAWAVCAKTGVPVFVPKP